MITEKIGKKCKQWMVKEFSHMLKESSNTFMANFSNLNVIEQEEIRNELRQLRSSFVVVKNSICKRVFNELNQKKLKDYLDGPTAIILVKDEPIKVTKVLVGFSKRYPNFEVKGGLIEEEVYSEDKLKELAELPSKIVLLAKFVGSVGTPMIRFLQILDMQIRRVVYVLSQIKDKNPKSQL